MVLEDGSLRLSAATGDDVSELVERIRDADRYEIEHLSRCSVEEAVASSYRRSDNPVAVRDIASGGLVALYGFAPVAEVGGVASPWLLGTDRLYRSPKTLVRRSRAVVRCVLKHKYNRLVNVVWAGNTRSIRYLERVGFKVGSVQETFFGVPFRKFEMEVGDV